MSESDPDILRQIERDERWLANHATPEPSQAAVTGVKSVVRRELLAERARPQRNWSPAAGVWAIAAMIALAVYVVWNASRTIAPAPSAIQPIIAQLPAATEISAPQEQTVLVTFDSKQKELEDWSKNANWDLSGSSLSEALNEIWSEPAKNNSEKGQRSS
jgi:hypothetical protein